MSENKKRKKAFYKGKYGGKKGRYENDLRPKLKGFIITLDGQEKHARGEAYRLLNEYADKRYGPEQLDDGKKDSENESDQDIEASLKQEVSKIKAVKDMDRRFQIIQNKAKNVLFVKTDIDDPHQLALDIFEDLAASGVAKTQHCRRLLPVIDTCHAKLNHIVEAAKPLLKTLFTEEQTPFTTYCMTWKVRCNDRVKRDDVYGELLEYIKQFDGDHEASYTDPDIMIDINIIGNICCFGFLRKWNQHCKYNLDAIIKKVHKESGLEGSVKVEEGAKANVENDDSESSNNEPRSEAKDEGDQPEGVKSDETTGDKSEKVETTKYENLEEKHSNDESAKISIDTDQVAKETSIKEVTETIDKDGTLNKTEI